IFAFDRGVPKQSSFCTVTLRVVDVNDNAPQFVYPTQKNHTIYASAFTPPGIPLVKLTAVDPDEGDNAQLSFHLDGDPAHLRIFHLDDKSGELSLLAARDPMESVGTYQLQLRVSDAGTPPLSGHASINIVLNKNPHTFSKYAMHSHTLDKTIDGSLGEPEPPVGRQPILVNRSIADKLLTRAEPVNPRTEDQIKGYYNSQHVDDNNTPERHDSWNAVPRQVFSYFSSERALIIIICLIALSAVIAFLFLVAIVVVRRKSVSLNPSNPPENPRSVPRIINTCTQPTWFDPNKSVSVPPVSFGPNKTWIIESAEKSYSPAGQSSMNYMQRASCSPLTDESPGTLELDKRSEQGNYQFCNELVTKTLDSRRFTPSCLESNPRMCNPCALLRTNTFSPSVNLHLVEDHLSYKCASPDSAASSPADFMDPSLQTAYQTITEREWVKRRGLDHSCMQ
ncbi:Protocadherin-7, partial [Fasciolopsis buskii]